MLKNHSVNFLIGLITVVFLILALFPFLREVNAQGFCGIDEGYGGTIKVNAKRCLRQWNGLFICDNNGEWVCNGTWPCTSGGFGGFAPCSGAGNPEACTVSVWCGSAYAPKKQNDCTISGGGLYCTLGCSARTAGCWVFGPTPTPGNGGTPTPTPSPPPPSCTISLPDVNLNVSTSQEIFVTIVEENNGTIERVDFVSSDTKIATVTTPDLAAPFSTTVTGEKVGSTTITGTATMDDGVTTCITVPPADSDVTITAPGPWWQVIDADIFTNSSLISSIPTATCLLPDCNPTFDLDGPGGYPGIPSYVGSFDFEEGSGTGTVSSTGWLADTTSTFRTTYDYAFFDKLRKSDVVLTEITSPSVNGGFFASGGTSSRGYVWYHFDGSTLGDLTINSNINLPGDRKVVVLVEDADLYIQGRINLNDGQGFFMVITGKDNNGLKGNIFIDPSVSHPTQIELEGVFLAEGEFRTGATDEQLHIRGSVAAYDGVLLERDLSDNSDEPAEVFEYAPDLIFTYPRDLTTRRYRWKEVAP